MDILLLDHLAFRRRSPNLFNRIVMSVAQTCPRIEQTLEQMAIDGLFFASGRIRGSDPEEVSAVWNEHVDLNPALKSIRALTIGDILVGEKTAYLVRAYGHQALTHPDLVQSLQLVVNRPPSLDLRSCS